MIENVLPAIYLLASVGFILAVKWMNNPATARRGVIIGEIGMLLAVIGTLLRVQSNFAMIFIGIGIGAAIGAPLAYLMPMTAVPQLTALSHAFGALASALIGTAEFYLRGPHGFTMAALSLETLLGALTSARETLAKKHGKRVPLVLKISPDLVREQIAAIAESVRRHRLEGVIATNTSVSRDGVKGLPHAEEAGGLSGRPIRNRATTVLKLLKEVLPADVTLIGAGGILSGGDAAEKFAAGADLVQLYTGLIYRGPNLVGECASAYRGK